MSEPGRRTSELSPLRVLALRGDLLTCTLPGPVPPGSRVGIRLAGALPSDPPATGKVVAVRRNREAAVEIDVRLHSLSPEQRSRLAAAVSPPG